MDNPEAKAILDTRRETPINRIEKIIATRTHQKRASLKVIHVTLE
jgi:hypothetical protein